MSCKKFFLPVMCLFLLITLSTYNLPDLCGAAGGSAGASGAQLELFFGAMDGQGWQTFFLADAVAKRVGGPAIKIYPLVIKNADGKFTAKKGEAELDESMRLAVLSRFYPDKLLAYLTARSLSPWTDSWRDAVVFCGLDPDEFARKAAAEGPGALAVAYDRSQKAGIQAVSLLINGKLYSGAQRLLPLLQAVNAVLPEAKRAALPKSYLDRLKQPLPQFLVVLSSSPFSQKNDALLGVFAKYFEGIKPTFLDYDSPERAEKLPGLTFTPAYIIEANAAAKERLESEIKAGIFREDGGWLVYYDHQRAGFYPGRVKLENTLELFVMSYCPFGTQAENALLEARKNGVLPAGLKLEIHYIGDAAKKEDGSYEFGSLHGQAEWEENLRQLVIARDFPGKFYDYLLERNKAINSTPWEDAATKAGIDPKKVSDAFAGGKKLLADDFVRSTALSVTTSPSFMWEGQAFMVGLAELAKIPGFGKVGLPATGGAGCGK
ncbi:MAG TPA: hypothetical protein DCL44_03260 [Elusimicrobia bacterium]|nr:hypothetical protein [Elusimicrobiota bacterium]